MEALKKIKKWFMGLSKRGKAFTIIGVAVVVFIILEYLS